MQTTIKYLTAACASAMLLACAGTGGGSMSGPLAAGEPATVPVQSADGYYILGRNQHAAGRHAEALQSYQLALRVDPTHMNARNGLAVLKAGQGDYAGAIALWQRLTETQEQGGAAERAFLFSNLGYAYFLSGDTQQALEALEKACLLDPLNGVSWDHLATVLDKLGQDERAAAMRKQAATLYRHDVKADYAMAGRSAVPAGQPRAESVPVAGAEANWPQAMARTEVLQQGAMVQVRRVTATPTRAGLATPDGPSLLLRKMEYIPAQAQLFSDAPEARTATLIANNKTPERGVPVDPDAASAAVSAPAASRVRLEIRNGNGITGMAAALARTVGGGRFQVIRLTNERNFLVARTRVEYGPQQEREARELASRLGPLVRTEQVTHKAADVRVILGHDLTDPVALHRRYMKELQLARLQLAKLG